MKGVLCAMSPDASARTVHNLAHTGDAHSFGLIKIDLKYRVEKPPEQPPFFTSLP
jgi:hypothetical protein